MFKNAQHADHAEFPRIAARIGEDPGRWLDGLDALTHTVESLIRGIEDLERALNWRYVAKRCDCDGAVRDRIDQRIRQLRRRPAANRMAPALRELQHATPGERAAIRDRVLSDVDGTDAKVVAAFCATLATDAPETADESAEETGSQPVDESEAETDEDRGREDVPLSQAREIVASMDRGRIDSLLQLEQASDQPRENILQALTERREELTTADAEVANA